VEELLLDALLVLEDCTSSMRSTSYVRYRCLKPSIRLSRSELMKSFMKVSLVM